MMIGSSRVRSSARRFLGQRDAGPTGQHPVEDHQVGQRGADGRFALSALPARTTRKTGMLEVDGDEFLDCRFVLQRPESSESLRLLLGVTDVAAFDDEHHLLGDVLGVVADALDGAGDGDDLDRGGDGARVFHHVRDQLADDGLEFGIDIAVGLDHLLGQRDVETGKASSDWRTRLSAASARWRMPIPYCDGMWPAS